MLLLSVLFALSRGTVTQSYLSLGVNFTTRRRSRYFFVEHFLLPHSRLCDFFIEDFLLPRLRWRKFSYKNIYGLVLSFGFEIYDDGSEVDDEVVDPNFFTEIFSETSSEISKTDSEEETDTILTPREDIEEELTEALQNEVELNDIPESRYYYGKNRFKWSAQQPQRFSRTPLHNIVRLPTAVGSQNIEDESENIMCRYWSKFFDKSVENIILEHTNKKLDIKFQSTKKVEAKPLDEIEFRAFLGLLLYTSIFKSNRESIDLIFATDGTGRDIFRATMSRLRFLPILSCLRFDNSSDRKERLLNEPLAAISEVFEKIIGNCKSNYSLSTHACIDEMLVPFRGRCKFKVYIPQKPAKYGIILYINGCTYTLPCMCLYLPRKELRRH